RGGRAGRSGGAGSGDCDKRKGAEQDGGAHGEDAMGGLTGRTALVTGAARGSGAAAARRLATEGVRVVLADLDGPGVSALADEIGQVAIRADVTRAEDIE